MKQFSSLLLTAALLLSLCLGCAAPPAVKTPQEPEPPAPASQSSFAVHFIDVGQADAALVLCDGEAMLIDGGEAGDSDLMYAYLKNHGIDRLSCVVATHGHEDHVGGLAGALHYATADRALCPVTDYDSDAFRNFVKALAQQGISITVPKAGDTFSLGSARVQILGPVNATEETNNTSIVLRIVYGETSFLFTGDAEQAEEKDILDAGFDVKCTVLKVGHHGSETSTSYRFLRQAAPQYAVLSVGKNSYSHPHPDILSRLRDAEATTFRTDLQGDILCVSDGKTVTFTVSRNADSDTLAGAGDGSGQTAEPLVWVPQSGQKYHSKADCSNMENPTQITLTEAEQRGFTACKRCH